MSNSLKGFDSDPHRVFKVESGKNESFEIIGFILDGLNTDDTLIQISHELSLRGIVCDGYGSKVLERERDYPTGLPTNPVCVAIPHSDKIYAYRSAIGVARVINPVKFRNMGSPNEELLVELIFLLAVPQDEDQILMIQTIMEIVQNQNALVDLMHANTEQELALIFQKHCIEQQKRKEEIKGKIKNDLVDTKEKNKKK